MVLVGALMAGEVLVLTLYAQEVLGYSPLVSGLIAIPQGVGGLLRGLVAARLLDRAGLRWFLATNWALAALSILVLFRFPATSHYPLLGIVLLGVGFGSTNVIFGGTIAGSTGVSNDEQGGVGALVNAARQIGAAIGVAVVLSVAAAGGQTSASGGASAAGYRLALLCWAGVAGAAAVLSLASQAGDARTASHARTPNARVVARPRAQIFEHRHDHKEPTMTDTSPTNAANAGLLDLAGDLTVHRLGYGAMRITGEGIWGEPPDRESQGGAAPRRRAGRQLHRHGRLVRAGGQRDAHRRGAAPLRGRPRHRDQGRPGAPGPGRWPANGRPEHLRAACEGSLRRLRVDRIRSTSSTGPTPRCPSRSRWVRSSSSRTRARSAHRSVATSPRSSSGRRSKRTPIVSVQNRYNPADRTSETMVDLCEQEHHLPAVGAGPRPRPHPGVEESPTARRPPRQVALAWLLARSPAMLPIPGTGSVAHLESNMAATSLELAPAEVAAITARRAGDS